MHRAPFCLAVCLLSPEVLPFVSLLFTFGNPELYFDLPVLPVEFQRDDRVTVDGFEAEKLPNLPLVEQQFTPRLGHVVVEVAEIVFVDVGVIEKGFIVLNSGEGVPDLTFSCSEGFDFRAFQHNASLEGLENMIIVPSLAIVENIIHRLALGDDSVWECRGDSNLERRPAFAYAAGVSSVSVTSGFSQVILS